MKADRITLLWVVHVLLGPTLGGLAVLVGDFPAPLSELSDIPVVSVVFAQAVLLGIWGVFGSGRWSIRCLGLVAGAAYLCLVVLIGQMELAGIIYAALVIVVTVVNYVVLGSTRIVKRLSLRRLEPTDKNVDESGFQFSVRGLLLATMLIAAALGAAKWLREALGDASFDVSMILIFTVWGGGFVGVGLAALWAALSTTNSPAMILAVLVAAGAMGAILPYAFEANWESYVYLPLIMMLETSAVMLTLVVVRSCGYRLVRSK